MALFIDICVSLFLIVAVIGIIVIAYTIVKAEIRDEAEEELYFKISMKEWEMFKQHMEELKNEQADR